MPFKEVGKNEKLNWENLNRYRCPKDNKRLVRNLMLNTWSCKTCSFTINGERMAEIGFDMEEGDDHLENYHDFFND